RRGDEAPRALLFDGSPLLPSGVYADPAGTLFVGRDAERMSTVEPSRFEPFPKRLVDEGSALLGETEVPVPTLLAAVLRRVVSEAVQAGVAPVGHLGQLVAIRAPAAWQRLSQPATPAEQRDRRAFWSEVRAAKEMLSRAPAAPVQVPGTEEALHLTREELERVAGPLIDRAVDETRRVLQQAGVLGPQLAGILLVGGSSRIPLVASRLHARFGLPPTLPEQPELPVAYGAL